MSEVAFTGERLHGGDALFAVDLARHRAAYEAARSRGPAARTLDLGSGSGHGLAHLAGDGGQALGLDRVAPDAGGRAAGADFVRADLRAPPFAPGRFDRVLCFQVIEHFRDPGPLLTSLASLLAPAGCALLTTPNRLTSDGVNPYHVHEYTADELARALAPHFARVEVLGVGASAPVRRYYEARARRVRRILRLDPLRLRQRLPPPLLAFGFSRAARLVRWLARSREGLPDASWRDFPVGPYAPDCLDLFAVCRRQEPDSSAGPRAARRSRA